MENGTGKRFVIHDIARGEAEFGRIKKSLVLNLEYTLAGVEYYSTFRYRVSAKDTPSPQQVVDDYLTKTKPSTDDELYEEWFAKLLSVSNKFERKYLEYFKESSRDEWKHWKEKGNL